MTALSMSGGAIGTAVDRPIGSPIGGGPAIAMPSPQLMVNDRGGPVPSPEILRELQRISPSLGLRWMANFEDSTYAVTWEWPSTDARWGRVQSGEISRESAYDILGYLPPRCDVNQAKGYIENHLKQYPKEEINRLRAKVAHWNEVEIPKAQVAEVIVETLDGVARDQRAPKGLQIFSGKSGRSRHR